MDTDSVADDMRGSVVFVWSDRALFLGDRSETGLHAHNAIELCVALDEAGIDMLDATGTHHASISGAVVRSNTKHRLMVHGPKVAVLYIEGQSNLAAGLDAWIGPAGIAPLPAEPSTRENFAKLLSRGAGLDDAAQAAQELVRSLVPDAPLEPLDARLQSVVAYLNARLDSAPPLAEAAAHAGLSASRLGHLFKAQLGLPMRRYVLWMRLRKALLEALAGSNMTEAAHNAGFADAAHFTRTCQAMFGLPPSAFAPVDDVLISPDDQFVQDEDPLAR